MYEALVPTLQPALLALAVVLLGIASLNDIAVRTIPDLASLGLIAIGIAIRLADGSAPTALVASIAVIAVRRVLLAVRLARWWRCEASRCLRLAGLAGTSAAARPAHGNRGWHAGLPLSCP